MPAKIVLNYDLQAELQDFPPSGTPIFLPRSDSQITLSAGAVYNLLEPTVPPQFRASCRLDPFDINLFNVVTLMFDGAQFINERQGLGLQHRLPRISSLGRTRRS